MQRIAYPGNAVVVVGANRHRIDATARQNAEQQLSQAAELDFVSRPLSCGANLQLSCIRVRADTRLA